MQELRKLEDADGRLRLPPRLDMQRAPALRDWFLAREDDTVLDASDVEVLTTPALQVLMAARDHLQSHGHGLTLQNPSDALCGCLQMLGVPLQRLVTSGDTA
ncbi:MAG: STAS domain-containing protein [Pseudomonadota bacterium]